MCLPAQYTNADVHSLFKTRWQAVVLLGQEGLGNIILGGRSRHPDGLLRGGPLLQTRWPAVGAGWAGGD